MIAYFTFISSIIAGIVLTFVQGENVTCGEPVIHPKTRRIIGGNAAEPGSWPWMAMLKENDSYACGGSILNDKFILTAAHCFFEGNHSGIPSQWQVYTGKYHTDRNDTTETLHLVKKIIPHEEFDKITFVHDIALVELQEPIIFTNSVRPVCLPESRPLENLLCYAIGWGDTRGTGDKTILNEVLLPIIKDFFCSLKHWYGEKFIKYETFCAGYGEGKRDGCSGDSGGPFNCYVKGKWYVQGVQSWAHDCGQPYRPGIYTNVFRHREWINTTMSAERTDHSLSI